MQANTPAAPADAQLTLVQRIRYYADHLPSGYTPFTIIGAQLHKFANEVDAALAASPAVPPGWQIVPKELTPEMMAAVVFAVLPDASPADFELARAAAKLALARPEAPPNASFEEIASVIATMLPAHRALLAASPSIPADQQGAAT